MAADGQSSRPPVFSSLEELSQNSNINKKRYEALVEIFEGKYGKKPGFVARAPGRVNLIGEHIDYSGYGVLPMAIEQDVAIACSANSESMIRIANVESSRFPFHECSTDLPGNLKPGEDKPRWYNYFLCGYKGAVERFGLDSPIGMDVVVSGSIPPSSGLSSSSAFVCCATLTTVYVNRVPLPSKLSLAELCAKSEKYIGTEGGGMDQAISFLGEPGAAKMVEFEPLRTSDLRLPAGAVIVVSNTLVPAKKAASDSQFNVRVVECRLAAQVIAKKKGLTDWRKIRKLHNLHDALGLPLSEVPSVVAECLHESTYSRDEICKILDVSSGEFESESLSDKTQHMTHFELYKRATHGFTEANRVLQFKGVANSNIGDSSVATKLGQLMDDSHASCRDHYECSCKELDELVSRCKASGALGSRLTGAGWGGCAISLVKEENIDVFVAAVATGYYEHVPERKAEVGVALFATKPGPGAALCQL